MLQSLRLQRVEHDLLTDRILQKNKISRIYIHIKGDLIQGIGSLHYSG